MLGELPFGAFTGPGPTLLLALAMGVLLFLANMLAERMDRMLTRSFPLVRAF